MNTRLWIAALATVCAMPCAQAETLYVVEQLFVSVAATPEGSGERIAQIKSGDKVELLDRQEDLAHVRLSSGQEGWVKASYLSAALPLQQQLTARSEELERVRKEKSQLETDLAVARRAANTASAAAPSQSPAAPATEVAAPDAPPAETSSREPVSQGAPPLFSESSLFPARPSWLWALGGCGVALILGFVLGWRMLDRRIRAKYGGLRIY